MDLKYREVVKRPALLQRLRGLNVKEFESLAESFSSQYDQQVIQPRVKTSSRQRAAGGGQKGAMPEVRDKLLFMYGLGTSSPEQRQDIVVLSLFHVLMIYF